ncbi:hypothetical protein E2N92_07720 [Methanofollis formosanus]|uniref:ParB/Sulfiredoxin domain-containing protein n=1 Tax=Methanofollis formosanus TaxID=299308 RepID=A0A8G1EGM9_9EURY|nr:hypothetical protein [Methanofollis formosanus]QYZ79321.1 hypothetical protein E2N92_07720 [Methanofollis formosanus]
MKHIVGTLLHLKNSSPGFYYSFRQIVSLYKYHRLNYYYLKNSRGLPNWPREVKDTVIRVHPPAIRGVSEMKFDTVLDSGAAQSGDWDIPKKKFIESLQFQAVRSRYLEGRSWEETEIFQTTAEELEQGRVRWGCSTIAELKKRFLMIDKLYETIKKNGYKSKREIIAEHINDPFLHFEPLDEVTVNIGRNGDLLFNDGAHRLSIALILGIEEIPVRIVGRHEDWQGPWIWKNENFPDRNFPDVLKRSSLHHR